MFLNSFPLRLVRFRIERVGLSDLHSNEEYWQPWNGEVITGRSAWIEIPLNNIKFSIHKKSIEIPSYYIAYFIHRKKIEILLNYTSKSVSLNIHRNTIKYTSNCIEINHLLMVAKCDLNPFFQFLLFLLVSSKFEF